MCVRVCVDKCTASAYNKAVASYFSLRKLKLLVKPLLYVKWLIISLYRVIDPSDICPSSFLYLKCTVGTDCGSLGPGHGKIYPVQGRGWQSWGTCSSLPLSLSVFPLQIPPKCHLFSVGKTSVHTWPLPLPQLMARFHSSNLRLQTRPSDSRHFASHTPSPAVRNPFLRLSHRTCPCRRT